MTYLPLRMPGAQVKRKKKKRNAHVIGQLQATHLALKLLFAPRKDKELGVRGTDSRKDRHQFS